MKPAVYETSGMQDTFVNLQDNYLIFTQINMFVPDQFIIVSLQIGSKMMVLSILF